MYVLDHHSSIANRYLAEVRDVKVQGDRLRFRHNLKRLGFLLGYEISKSLDYNNEFISTPLSEMEVSLPSDDIVIVTIMRAGLPFQEGFLDAFDNAEAGFVGAWREEESDIEVNLNYLATADLTDKTVLIVDPMLATGKSLVKAVGSLLDNGKPRHIHIATVIASPEGVTHLQENMPTSYQLWTCALDEKLNDKFYIVPGLGDAGDLAFGEKL